MSNFKSYCSLSYHNLSDEALETFSIGVKAGYYGNNPPFTVLPLTEVAFGALITDYAAKRADYVNGGESQKGPFMLARAALMAALDLLATETDIVADGNIAIIELAGFEPTKVGSSSAVIPGQCEVSVKRGIAGELITSCPIVPGAKHYGCIITQGAPLPEQITLVEGKLIFAISGEPGPPPLNFPTMAIDLTDQRVKHFRGLTHDDLYYFYYFAVNAAGVGPLSVEVSMICW